MNWNRHKVRTAWVIWAAALALPACTSPADPMALHQTVNPFIGTGGHGHTYPGATSPFGMVQLSPDTRLDGWDGCGGYHHSDEFIYGFSHTHLQGTGVSDYGDILFMPCTQFRAGSDTWSDRYKSAFSHASETAEAGYYRVFLEDHHIDAELTTTPRVGIHRYRLEEPDTLTLIVDLEHRDNLLQYSIFPLNDSTLVGHRISDNWAREQHVYFAARFDQPFDWQDQLSEITVTDTLEDGTLEQEVVFVPIFACDFGVISELNVRVALSFVDIKGALKNLKSEAAGTDFDRYREQASSEWNEHLGRVTIEGGTSDERSTFYTALYHCMTTPNIASDVDGRYRGTDLNIHQLENEEGAHYTVFSLWDTFRALHPLLNWLEPVRSLDFIRTMLRMYEQGGQLPVWELAGNYTGCMIGYHSVPVIADAVRWKIHEFDQNLALKAMVQAADSAHLGLPSYQSNGYIPLDLEHESVSKTLEYAFDDACIAMFTKQLTNGSREKHMTQERFNHRALSYRNLFNPETGFLQPKRGGAWLENFEPREVNFNYTEANGWQYNFFAPHDINGHIELMGGDSAYAALLDAMFTGSSEMTGRQQSDITGLIGQYAHGNEPSHHMAYLFPYVGKSYRTSELVRQICQELYTNAPDGLSGNEDCGQMSAWYVWSALGLYPVCPGSEQIIAGNPLFDAAHVIPAFTEAMPRAPLHITSEGRGNYIDSWSLNQKMHAPSWIEKSALMAGGTLAFQRSDSPSSFGNAPSDRPEERWNDESFVPVPIILAPRTFQAPLTVVSVQSLTSAGDVQYRICDATIETCHSKWITYTEPFEVRDWVRIEAKHTIPNVGQSPVISHQVRPIRHDHHITLSTPFDPQYAAGGDQALIDGIQGRNMFKTGDWQGFWGKDVIATVDMGQLKNIKRLELGALRDNRPWIFLPRSVAFYVSIDGHDWTHLETISHGQSDVDESLLVHRFQCDIPVQARYARAEVANFGVLPPWHLGAGNPSWIFLDEFDIHLE